MPPSPISSRRAAACLDKPLSADVQYASTSRPQSETRFIQIELPDGVEDDEQLKARALDMTPPSNVNKAILQALAQILVNQQNMKQAPPPNATPEAERHGRYSWIATQLIRNKTKTYGGEVDPIALSEWFRELEKSFLLYTVSEADKVRLASHFLVREADQWWLLTGPTAEAEPEFGWTRFRELVEARFYPNELKQQKLKEFLDFKQGSLSVHEFTIKFNALAHYAKRLIQREEDKAFFYRDKLAPKVKGKISRSSSSFVEIYNDALWAETSNREIAKEAQILAVTSTSPGKRPLYLTSMPFSSESQPLVSADETDVVAPSLSYPGKRRNLGYGTPPSSNRNRNDGRMCHLCKKPSHPGIGCYSGRKCYHCKRPLHPRVGCYNKPLVCYTCGKPGHACPETKIAAPTPATPVTSTPQRPRGQVFTMSRAEADDHPEIYIGEEFEDGLGNTYIIED